MIGNKGKTGTVQTMYGAFLHGCMRWFYLFWIYECDMILLSVEFVTHGGIFWTRIIWIVCWMNYHPWMAN